MARQRVSFTESTSWFHPSQVFADTQRVDLFDDPKWETSPLTYPGRSVPREPRARSFRSLLKSAAVRLVPMKRGQHSHTAA
jgi:hypothetical protein